MYIEWDKIIGVIVGIVIVAIVALMAARFVVDSRVQKLCLQHGWANHGVTWDLQGFCIREENEYEIVKPLSEILAEGQ